MRFIGIAALAVTFALPAVAKEMCDVPQDQWRPVEELRTELTAKGWTISKVKKEDGCYEVYGKDDKGARVEVFIDPKTFEVVGSDD